MAQERRRRLEDFLRASPIQAEKPRRKSARSAASVFLDSTASSSLGRARGKEEVRAGVGRVWEEASKAARDLGSSESADREDVSYRCSYAGAFSASRSMLGKLRGAGRQEGERSEELGEAATAITFFETDGVEQGNVARAERNSDVQRERETASLRKGERTGGRAESLNDSRRVNDGIGPCRCHVRRAVLRI